MANTRERVALAGWSLHRRFRCEQTPLTLLEFPQIAAEEFAIREIELNSPFFEYVDPADKASSPVDERFLDELASAAEQAGVRIGGVAVDHHGELCSLDETERQKAVRQHAKWGPICRRLGADYYRANSGGKSLARATANHGTACSRSFRELAEHATEYSVAVLMENHWGLSDDPQRMVRILRAANHPCCGALADFRNWPAGVDPLMALEAIAPYVRVAHAKFLKFDAHGEDPDFDTARAVAILRAAGFKGRYAIEFEGTIDDHEGVLASKRLIERHLGIRS